MLLSIELHSNITRLTAYNPRIRIQMSRIVLGHMNCQVIAFGYECQSPCISYWIPFKYLKRCTESVT